MLGEWEDEQGQEWGLLIWGVGWGGEGPLQSQPFPFSLRHFPALKSSSPWAHSRGF